MHHRFLPICRHVIPILLLLALFVPAGIGIGRTPSRGENDVARPQPGRFPEALPAINGRVSCFCRYDGMDRRSDDTVYYNQVVRLKSGRIIIGRVQYDPESDRYTIKLGDGSMQSVLHRDVELIEEYSRTQLPPLYDISAPIYPCDERQRERQWYFLEARVWGMYAGQDKSINGIGLGSFTPGLELVPGLRLGNRAGLGVGIGFFRRNEINRFPLVLHGRYQISLSCLSPYLYVQAGTVFDDQSDDHIAMNKIFHPGPKIAGFGIGLDYPIASWLDLSADVGYRYMQLPTRVPCDCDGGDPLETAVFYNESHGILLRIGVTF